MVMTNARYITPSAERYVQKSKERLMRLKAQRDKQRRREMTSGFIFIAFGIVFSVSLVYFMINSGNLTMDSSGFSNSFEILLKNR